MGSWWSGMSLVLKRGLAEQVRSRTFKVVLGLLLLLAVAAVTIPRLVGTGTTTYTLATVGPAPADLTATLGLAARAVPFEIRYLELSDDAQVRASVRDEEATAGLSDTRLYVPERVTGTFPAIVSQSIVALDTEHLLAELGLTPTQVQQLQSVRPPEQVPVGALTDTSRAAVGFAVGVILYLALMFSGTLIATTVATEKSTRISEVLLAVLRPSQILVGTVLAVGVATAAQLLVLAAPIAVTAWVTDAQWLPSVAAVDISLGVLWFLLGFALFGFLYAAGGALVDKVTDAGMAVLPVTAVVIAGYVLGVIVVATDPVMTWSVFFSMFPLTAPLTMPIRWAAGEVPVWQLVLSMVLTAATAVAFVWVTSSVYRRALVITGRRVRIRELVRRGPSARPHFRSRRVWSSQGRSPEG